MSRRVLAAWTSLTIVFLYLPLAVVVAYAFNANRRNVAIWTGFTTRWFGDVLRDPTITGALWTSLRIAVATSVLAMVLGTLAALGLRGAPGWLRAGVDSLAYLTLVTPVVVTGIASLVTFVLIGIPRGALTVLLAHSVFTSSIVLLIVRARLAGLDRAEEEAALDLGASVLGTLRQVTLPRLAPAIAAGGLLAFTYSWDDYVIASFVTGPETTTLPIRIFAELRFGVSPRLDALAAVTLVVTGAALTSAYVLLRRSRRAPERTASG